MSDKAKIAELEADLARERVYSKKLEGSLIGLGTVSQASPNSIRYILTGIYYRRLFAGDRQGAADIRAQVKLWP